MTAHFPLFFLRGKKEEEGGGKERKEKKLWPNCARDVRPNIVCLLCELEAGLIGALQILTAPLILE